MLNKPPLLVILGPTGSGKSDLAIKIAKRFNGEIVNADSRQVYKEMYVGTGSPLAEITNHKSQITNKLQIQNSKSQTTLTLHPLPKGEGRGERENLKSKIIDGVPHHLFHIIAPDQEFTVAHYKELAMKTIANIHARGKLPILVGGTGLYIRAVVDNLNIPPVAPNKKLRKEFERELQKAGANSNRHAENGKTEKSIFGSPTSLGSGTSPKFPALSVSSAKSAILQKYYQRLLKLDPEATKMIDPLNPRRIIRALEVCLARQKLLKQHLGGQATKKPWSTTQQKGEPLFNVLKIGLKLPRQELYKKIDQRVEKMFKNGLIEETKKLIKKYPLSLPAMSGIGYQEVGSMLGSPTSQGSGTSPKFSAQSAPYKGEKSPYFPLLQRGIKGDFISAISKIQFRTHAYARRQMTWFRKEKNVRWIKTGNMARKLARKFLREYKLKKRIRF